jgi:hypothetical protein
MKKKNIMTITIVKGANKKCLNLDRGSKSVGTTILKALLRYNRIGVFCDSFIGFQI